VKNNRKVLRKNFGECHLLKCIFSYFSGSQERGPADDRHGSVSGRVHGPKNPHGADVIKL
jgi:hypothetical protein